MSDKEGEKFDTGGRCRKTDSSSFFHALAQPVCVTRGLAHAFPTHKTRVPRPSRVRSLREGGAFRGRLA